MNCLWSETTDYHHCCFRSSRPEVFCKKGVLRNFAKFTGKHLCHSLFFNKNTLLKKRLWHGCFPVNLCEIIRTRFFTEHMWLLLLLHKFWPEFISICSLVLFHLELHLVWVYSVISLFLEIFLDVPVWALPILCAHPSSRTNFS